MELKKSEGANIDKLRLPITLIGLLFVGSLVLASFSYTSAVEREQQAQADTNAANVNYDIEDVPEPETPPETPPQVDVIPPPSDVITPVVNTETIPEPIMNTPPPVITAPVEQVVVQEEIIDFPDVEATFPGGAAAMQKWIADNVKYPQTSIEMNEQGRVYLSFVVEPDGSISNIAVERGVSGDLDREAKRLLRKMPPWIAGEAKGRKARTRCRLPINFTLY